MMDKLELGDWRSEVSSWGDKRHMPQLLWGSRLALMGLALLACLYGLLHFVTLMGSSDKDGVDQTSLQLESSGQTDNPAAQLTADTVSGWGWSNEAGTAESLAPAPVIEESVKQTRLQMRLEGIVKSDQEQQSVAIIAIENESKQYKKGDKLPVAPGVSLRTIDVDRIILDNNGSLEELLLFSKSILQERRDTRTEAPPTPTNDLLDQSDNADVTTMMGWYLEQIQQNPSSINQMIKFSVHTEEGKLAGFKVGAAGNQEDFRQLGLEDGDVVTHINGVDLSDYRKAMDLYQEMGDLSEVRVQLLRQGQSRELVFRLPGKG
jgi:general secretion pathway protein C